MSNDRDLTSHAPLVDRLRGRAWIPGVDYTAQAQAWMLEAADELENRDRILDDLGATSSPILHRRQDGTIDIEYHAPKARQHLITTELLDTMIGAHNRHMYCRPQARPEPGRMTVRSYLASCHGHRVVVTTTADRDADDLDGILNTTTYTDDKPTGVFLTDVRAGDGRPWSVFVPWHAIVAICRADEDLATIPELVAEDEAPTVARRAQHAERFGATYEEALRLAHEDIARIAENTALPGDKLGDSLDPPTRDEVPAHRPTE